MRFKLYNPDKKRRRWSAAVWVKDYRHTVSGHWRHLLGDPATMTDVVTQIGNAQRLGY